MDHIKYLAKAKRTRNDDANKNNILPEYKNGIRHWNLTMKSGTNETKEGINCEIRKALKCLKRRKITSTWQYWKWGTSEDQDDILKPSSAAEISSKE